MPGPGPRSRGQLSRRAQQTLLAPLAEACDEEGDAAGAILIKP